MKGMVIQLEIGDAARFQRCELEKLKTHQFKQKQYWTGWLLEYH